MRKDLLNLLATVEIVVFREDSPFVPFRLHEIRHISPSPSMDSEDGICALNEELSLLETEGIDLPIDVRTMDLDSMATIKAEFWGRWYSYETDYGPEYNAEFEFRNAQVKIEPLSAINHED